MRTHRALLLLSLLGAVSPAMGQVAAPIDSTAGPATQPAPDSTTALPLGDVFASRVNGIQLNPPAGGTLVRQVAATDFVRFLYPDRSWELKLRIVRLQKPMPLSLEGEQNLGSGLLQLTVEQLKSTNPSAEVLKQDVIEVGQTKVGFIAARYNSGVDRILTQQAIFRIDPSTFFVLNLITPGMSKANQEKDAGDDPREVLAARTFEAILPTVKVLENARAELKQEQDERLFRTRELLASWDEKRFVAALVPEQYMRVIRDGKDVGYLKVNEQQAEHANHPGVEIVLRSHFEGDSRSDSARAQLMPAPTGELVPSVEVPGAAKAALPTHPPTLDRVAKLFVTFDRMHEDWSMTTTTDDGRLGPVTTSELGNSDKEIRRVLDRKAVQEGEAGDPSDLKQPPVKTVEKYTLSVSTYAKVRTGVPVVRDLQVFYLPQAAGHLLPRLLPLDEQRTYMFTSYVNDQREVMTRYVDVLREQDAVLNDHHVRAIPVKDRIGVEGSATTHYMTRDGQWLGSVNEEQKIVVLPADEAEVRQIWHEIKLPADPAPVAEQAVGKVR